tara:strand:+ start:208 stop:507 length:300 start_codon:yes stop_codon:yes gene_type:complete
MAKTVKFTEEELKSVENIRNSYLDIQQQFGQVHIAEIKLGKQLDQILEKKSQLEKDLSDLGETETKFIEGVTKKYGDGQLNPETGDYVVSPSQSNQNKS